MNATAIIAFLSVAGIQMLYATKLKSRSGSADKEEEEVSHNYHIKNPFHLAIPVHSMKAARDFYGKILCFSEGRRSEDKWQDYNMYGHQLVCHYVGDEYRSPDYYNPVDGDEVPVPHFGVVLNSKKEFEILTARLLQANPPVNFIIQPTLRFKNQPGEQWTCFFKDPSNNSIEFKFITNPANLFARYNV